MDKRFDKIWNYVTQDQEVTIEIRLFRLVSLTVAVLCGFVILPTNLIQDLSVYLNVILGVYTLAATYLFLCSCRGRHYIKIFYLMTLLVLNSGWFLNAGSAGSIGFYFFAAVLFPLVFFRGRTRLVMFLLLVLDYCALLLVEQHYPALVVPFKTHNDRLIDLLTGFPFSALASALVFWVVVTTLERELEERKRAERSLIANEATLKMLLDFMPSGIWWYAEGGNIEYLNRCFLELFGYTLEDIPTVQDWFGLAYPDESYRLPYLTARNGFINEGRKNGTAVPLREAKITCKDGSVKHVIIKTQFVLGRTLEIFTDITEREMIQDQMLRVDKLESLGVLAGGIAHDFNNILTGIMGNVSLAQLLVEAEHGAFAPLQRAEKASVRAAELARQLLTFAKGGQPVKARVHVGKLLEESLSFSLLGSGVQGVLSAPATLRFVEADEGQLSQAFNNIINAVHAMPNGGRLTVGGENIALNAANPWGLPAGDYVRLSFADQGGGIPESDQKNIFDPYFTTKAGGSGLGLASTHSIVTRHGGHIAVLPPAGAGAVFVIHLPALGETAEQLALAPLEEPAPGATGAGSVLVMDDEEMICNLAAQMLSRFGYRVRTCASGEEAVGHYRAARDQGTPFAAVILDLTIPGGMGGKETARQLLALDRDAKLIVSTGYSQDMSIAEWSWYGFHGFLPKPYAAADLLKVLTGVLHARPQGPAAASPG